MILAETLDQAIGKLLDHDKSPSPKTGLMDNRGSHFYLAMYWAQALAEQSEDTELQAHFAPLAKTMSDKERDIIDELDSVQGEAVDIGGYYFADPEKTKAIMRPSATLNRALRAARIP
jgi:isocitrate dehydrogenase